jgi:phage-related protein
MADMTLLVKLIGDASSLSKSLSDTQDKLEQMANKNIPGTNSKLQSLGDKCTAVGSALSKKVTAPLVAVGGSLVAVGKNVADYSDHIDKMSQKLGLSREGFQEWDYILSQNGASIDSMKGGMKKLVNSMDSAVQKGSTAGTAFERLGLSLEDLQGKSREEVFETTITALQGVGDESERAALANELLGKSGAELAPLLNAGAGSVEELKQKAHELGLVLDDETIDSGVRMTDALDTMNRSFQSIKNAIGAAVMPIIADLAEYVAGKMPIVTEKIRAVSDAFNNLSPTTKKIIEIVAGLAAAAGPALMIGGKLMGRIDGIISKGGILGKILGGLTSPVGLAVLAIGGLVAAFVAAEKAPDTFGQAILDFIKNIGTKFVQFINELPERLKGLGAKLKETLSQGLSGAGEGIDGGSFLTSFIQTVTQVIASIRQAILDNAPEILTAVAGILSTVIEYFAQNAPQFLETGIQVFKTLIEAITTVLPEIVAAIATMIPTIVNALITALPVLLDGAITFFLALVDALPVVLPQILNALTIAIPQIVDALITALPILLDGAIQFFMALVEALPEILPELLAALGTLVIEVAGTIIDHLPELLTAALEFFGALVTAFVNIHKKVLGAIGKFLVDIGEKLVNGVKTKIDELKEWLGNKWEGIKTTASRTWDGIKEAITKPIEKARDAISKAWEKVKSILETKISIPHIKLPHFSISGSFSLDPPQVPHLDIDWYKTGGLFNRPSVIGVGEAGPEAVAPIDKLKAYVTEAVTNARTAIMDYTPIDSLANAIASGFAMQSAGQQGGEYHFTVELGGARVAEKIFTLNREGEMIVRGA